MNKALRDISLKQCISGHRIKGASSLMSELTFPNNVNNSHDTQPQVIRLNLRKHKYSKVRKNKKKEIKILVSSYVGNSFMRQDIRFLYTSQITPLS